MSPDLFKYEVNDDTLPEMRVGQIGTVKGKLEEQAIETANYHAKELVDV